MANSTIVISTSPWLVETTNDNRTHGVQIDWDELAASPVAENFTEIGANGVTRLVVPDGTILAKAAGGIKYVPRQATSNVAQGILIGLADQASSVSALSGFGFCVGGVVNETFLPDAGHGSFATWKGELQINTVGFYFVTHTNSMVV